MYKESDFEYNEKWFLVGAAGLMALCQLILLFSEFSFYSSIGMLFNGLYHLCGVLCPGLIIYLILKKIEDEEVYSSYAIALFLALGAIVDICLFVKYLSATQNTEGMKPWLLVIIIILFVFELLYAFVFIKYGLDKVTSVLPLLFSLVEVILRGCIYSAVDSKIQTFAYKTVNKSIFSIWEFMALFFFFAMIICLILYLDSSNLMEVIQNPKDLFKKETLFGTYTNLYLTDNKPNKVIQTPNSDSLSEESTQNNMKVIAKCSECGNDIYEGNTICTKCGCPVSYVSETINQAITEPITESETIQCPECGIAIKKSDSICTGCGYPINKYTFDNNTNINTDVNTNNLDSQFENINKKKKEERNKTQLIVGIIISLIILFVILILWYRNDINSYRSMYLSSSYSADKAKKNYEEVKQKYDELGDVYSEILDSVDNNTFSYEKDTIWRHYMRVSDEVSIISTYDADEFLSGIRNERSDLLTEMTNYLDEEQEYLIDEMAYSISMKMSFGSFLYEKKVIYFISVYSIVVALSFILAFRKRKK